MKKLKPSWDDVQKALPAINESGIDYSDMNPVDGDINFIRNSNGRQIPVRVILYNNERQMLDATVHFYGSPRLLYHAALYMLERRLDENNLAVEWDSVQFVGNSKIFPKFDPLGDELVQSMKTSLMLPLEDTVKVIREISEKFFLSDDFIPHDLILRARTQSYYSQLSAAILAHTAIVKSDDMERMIFERRWHLPMTRFKPQGLEF